MSKNLKQSIIVLLSLGLIFAANIVIWAWTAPTQAPPAGNVAAPINVSAVAQSKLGDFNIGPNLKYWITKYYDSFALKNDAGGISFVVGQDGNIGIGTTEPGAKLEIQNFTGFEYQKDTYLYERGSPRCSCDDRDFSLNCPDKFSAIESDPDTCYDWTKEGRTKAENVFNKKSIANQDALTIKTRSAQSAIYAEQQGDGYAGYFSGKTKVDGNLEVNDVFITSIGKWASELYPVNLYNNVHTGAQCSGGGGEVVSDGSDKFCRFAGSSCLAGWLKFKSWTTTTPGKKSYKDETVRGTCITGCVFRAIEGYDTESCSTSDATCTTDNHAWADLATIETKTCTGAGVKRKGEITFSSDKCDDFGLTLGDYVDCGITYSCSGATKVTATASVTRVGCY